jgi:hypothetical protein
MKSISIKVMAWFRKTYQALKDWEAALDYRYEDYAQERMLKLEERIAALEAAVRK